jgi:hypothetical protein
MKEEGNEEKIPWGMEMATPVGEAVARAEGAGLSRAGNCISSKITWQEI